MYEYSIGMGSLLLPPVLLAYFVVQAFWGYKLRHFFRIFPGLLAGLLISFTTGYLMFMDGARGDLTRFLMDLGGGRLLSDAISDGNIFKLLRLLATNDTARDLLMKILPDSAKIFMAFSVLVCIACTVVCAALEKPGVFLELFAYGYTITASIFVANGSTLLGAILGIAVGALLGALGYRISRGWIIVAPNLIDWLISSFFLLSAGMAGDGNGGNGSVWVWVIVLAILLLLIVIPVGVYKQFKATAVHMEGAAQSAVAPSMLKSSLTAKVKSASTQVMGFARRVSSRLSQGTPAAKGTPSAGGQRFCPKCGSPLNPGAKFCPKCGHAVKN